MSANANITGGDNLYNMTLIIELNTVLWILSLG